ncbi:MAG TPA: isochorismatase family protein [Verrucomicrobiae bacterium]|jgi:nicotinamidase-related amidase|nr:isochorismatase family protein [Verrucomicrobiae bacterium]
MPNHPVPKEVAVDAKTTALLVLDLNARCENPEERCHKLVEPVAKFLGRARDRRIFIVYTASDRYKGTAEERMPRAFDQRKDEPVIFPPAFDKFYSGELQPMLQARAIKTVIVCGASSNQAVLYTATAAARPFGYEVVIPVDGLIARGDYEHEFTLHQFTILPGGAAEKFKITEFDKIRFS